MTVYLVVLLAVLNSIAAFLGPSTAGFGIELAGYRPTFALLAVVAMVPGATVLLHRRLIPSRVRHEGEEQGRNAFDLLGIAALRQALIGSLFVAAAAYLAVPALGSAQPLTIILTYNHAPRSRTGEALGMRIMANKVTQIGIPLLFGGIGAALGSVPVFLATSAVLLGGGVLSLVSRRP